MHMHFGSSYSWNRQYSFSPDYPPSKTIEQKEWYVFLNTDIYIMMVSSVHQICKKDYYVAIVSTTVETNNPEQ